MYKYKCLLCGRLFDRKGIPHNCNSGYRKRKFQYKEISKCETCTYRKCNSCDDHLIGADL